MNVPAPVPASGCAVKALHSSCHQRQRLLELRLAKCPEPELIWLEIGFAKPRQIRFAETPPATTSATTSTRRADRGGPLERAAALAGERTALLPAAEGDGGERGDGGSAEHDRGEDAAVERARRVRLAVGGDPGQGERDAEDRDAGAAAERERGHALDPVGGEQHPGDGREHGERDADARVGEQRDEDGGVEQDDARGPAGRPPRAGRDEPERDWHARSAEQPELVPVAERRPEPGDALVVGIERGDALGEERPAEERREQPGGCARAGERRPRQPRAEHDPGDGERRIDEHPVRRLPGAIRGERPGEGGAHPDDEPEHAADEDGAGALDPHRRRPAGERRGERQHRGRERERPDPDEPRHVGAVREEERAERGRAGAEGGDEAFGSGPFSRGAHRR